MKKIISIFYLLLSCSITAQIKIDSIQRTISYQQVHEISASKSLIQQNAYKWIAKKYNDSNNVIKLNTPDNLILKALFKVSAPLKIAGGTTMVVRNVFYTLDLKFKDNKYKIEINDLVCKLDSDMPAPLLTYFMDENQYKQEQINAINLYPDGIAKSLALKSLDNSEKLKKLYLAQKDHDVECANQIIQHLHELDAELFNYLKQQPSDNW